MRKKNTIVYIFEFILFWTMSEVINLFIPTRVSAVVFFNAPVLFLNLKILYDMYNRIFFKKKIFSYIEDYVKEILTIILISIIAGGIAYITEILIGGHVTMTILSTIAVLYLSKKNTD